MRNTGFTLLEVSISMAILSIVSLLGFVVLKSSTESAGLAQAKAEVQANLRDVMAEITSEVRQAYTQRMVDVVPPILPEGTESIRIAPGNASITFQVPQPTSGPDIVAPSIPITIAHENEDVGGGSLSGNSLLDPGEDVNEDGVLSRRVLRSQGGVTTVLGGANNISSVLFQLVPNQSAADNNLTSLVIRLAATKRYGPGFRYEVREILESTVDLKN